MPLKLFSANLRTFYPSFNRPFHYSDVMMRPMASQITSLTIVFSTVYSGADHRKHQISASLAFVRGIHRWPTNSPHKGPVTRKMSPLDDDITVSFNDVPPLPHTFALLIALGDYVRISYQSYSKSCEFALWWMPQYIIDDELTMVQVMVWCRQATSHYLIQCWPKSVSSLSPKKLTRPRRVKTIWDKLHCFKISCEFLNFLICRWQNVTNTLIRTAGCDTLPGDWILQLQTH